MVVKILSWILKKLGWHTMSEAEYQKMVEDANAMMDTCAAVCHERDDAKTELQAAQRRIASVEFMTMEEYLQRQNELDLQLCRQKEENAKVMAQLDEGIEFYRTVEKALAEALHTSDDFGFPSAQTFPGSMSGEARIVENHDGVEYVVVDSRGILPAEINDKLRAEPQLHKRYSMAINCLYQYRMFDTLLRNLVQNGGAEFSLGYNAENQTYELYCRILCRLPKTDKAFTIE